MKNILKLITLMTTSLFAQSKGDIAFIGYNADGDDDFAIVALSDIPAGTTIYFTDSEPNVSGTGMIDDSEGVLTWVVGESILTAGTVVTFTDTDNDTNPAFGASNGTITRSNAGFLLTASEGDNIFATLGNPASDEVTVWLAGFEYRNTGQGTNFSQTGLTVGVNYLVINDTASKDGGQYTGVRTGKTISEYRDLINNEENWDTETEDGESVLPFNSTNFELVSLFNSINTIPGLKLSVENKKITTNIGSIINVCDVLGKQVVNQDLPQGIYLVTVKQEEKMEVYKVAI
ncbi:hypothetical protein AXE80_13090 [Wenyingzhuangia fucanilytica]|uniref:Secretion system C-terminal sorting domain-containing protein n=1 Tax=Wenyingzhuangia fucanilytica TaxID=1790137 RepID=A0A1B1Y8R3_9FLAO|nr:hypothetical protein [Wenyingzhuangia fucanilytica]ANW97163.1 hypothetical protein AXE80_13090 [Wenyingzhuangia fucanilytica]